MRCQAPQFEGRWELGTPTEEGSDLGVPLGLRSPFRVRRDGWPVPSLQNDPAAGLSARGTRSTQTERPLFQDHQLQERILSFVSSSSSSPVGRDFAEPGRVWEPHGSLLPRAPPDIPSQPPRSLPWAACRLGACVSSQRRVSPAQPCPSLSLRTQLARLLEALPPSSLWISSFSLLCFIVVGPWEGAESG